MQDFGLPFEMCVHGSLRKERFKNTLVPLLSKERLGKVFSITQNSSSQLRCGLNYFLQSLTMNICGEPGLNYFLQDVLQSTAF